MVRSDYLPLFHDGFTLLIVIFEDRTLLTMDADDVRGTLTQPRSKASQLTFSASLMRTIYAA